MLLLAYYVSASGRGEAAEYISRLPERVRGHVLADLEAYRLYGAKAPISWKPISGSRPMFEIRIGAQRVYCVATGRRSGCSKRDRRAANAVTSRKRQRE